MASSSMPSPSGNAHYYIGCKISLISKSDIRYEGILYTLDQAASTVALSNVNSFGTEDRRKDNVIPARDQTYEYILFRGSDIKDIVVCEPPRLDLFTRRSEPQLADPAILEVTSLPAQGAPPVSHLGSLHAERPPVHDYPPPVHAEDRSRNYTASNPGRGGYRGSSREGGYRQEGEYRSDGGGYRSGGNQDGYRADTRDGGYRNQERGGYDGPSHRNYDDGGYRRGGMRYNNSSYPSRNFGASQPPRQSQPAGRRNDAHNQSSGATGSQDTTGTPTAAQTKNLPDYDFETAEKVFHELESQAKKLTLNEGTGESATSGGMVKKDDDASNEPTKYYDPNSFFDKISCEALEKEKNPGQRPDWKRERQVNSETFGFTGYRSRNFSGGHQGRGGYRGYNREGGYRSNNQEGGYRSSNQEGYRSGNQDGGYRNQERGGGGYDGAGRSSNYDDGGYRPRGGMRYSGSSNYPSRNFGPSQRQTQTAGWNDPEEYFRCPDSPQRRRHSAVHFENRRYRDYSYEDDYPVGPPATQGSSRAAGGRRRRGNRGHDAGEDTQPAQPKATARNQAAAPRQESRVRNDDQSGPKRRTFRNRSRGAGQGDAQPRGSTAAGEGDPAPPPAPVAGPNPQRKQRGGRKKDEWVQYEMPSNCKGLLPQDKSDVTGTPKSSHGATSLLSFLDSGIKEAAMAATKSSDWGLGSSGTDTKDLRFSGADGLTGVDKLDGDVDKLFEVEYEAI